MTVQIEDRIDIPDAAIRAAASTWGMRMISAVAGAYGIIQGISILMGGSDRFGGPGLRAALALPGSPESVGAAILVLGVVVLVGLKIRNDFVTEAGLLLQAAWSLGFAITFLVSSLNNPGASTTGFNAYTFIAIVSIIPAAVSHSSHPRRKHKHA